VRVIGRHLARDAAALAVGQAVVRLVGLVSTLYVARWLGPAAFGTLSFGLALALVLSACAGLGLDDLVTRELARAADAGTELLGDALVVRLAALPLGAIAVLGLTLGQPGRWPLYLALLVYGLLHSYVLLACAVLRARRRMPLQSVLLGVEVLLAAAGALLAARTIADAAAVAVAYALASGAALALGLVLLRRSGMPARWRWRPAAWPSRVRAALPFAATMAGILLYDRLALMSTAVLVGQADAGWLGAAQNVVLGLSSLPSIVMLAAFPALAHAAKTEPWTVRPAGAALAGLVGGAGLVLAAALHLLAPAVVPLIFGPDYTPSIDLLRVLVLGAPPFFLTMVFVAVLEATDRQSTCPRAVGAALVVATPATLAAVWLWGAAGAAAAYAAAHLLLAALLAPPALLGVRQPARSPSTRERHPFHPLSPWEKHPLHPSPLRRGTPSIARPLGGAPPSIPSPSGRG
jgi:O-antigen/teichoic acid export membrane protein